MHRYPTEEIFKCLANEGRLSLLMLIQAHEEVCVCEITQVLSISQPVVSQGLKILKEHGFLISERRGKWHFYQLNPEMPKWMLALLQDLNEQDAMSIKDKPFTRLNCGATTNKLS